MHLYMHSIVMPVKTGIQAKGSGFRLLPE